MDVAGAEEQLAAIAEFDAIARELEVPVWLRGGWAVDLLLGRVTREHLDIDWFVVDVDAPRLTASLMERGFVDVTTAPKDQQVDLQRGDVEHGISFLTLDRTGEPLVAGGPWAGEPWPIGMLNGPVGRIGDVSVQLISTAAQIEIKEMMPTWNPAMRRRQKDLDDIALLRTALS